MDNVNIVNPFYSSKAHISFAVHLRTTIDGEKDFLEFLMSRFNELGGNEARGHDYLLAQLYKLEAEGRKNTIHVLERINRDFLEALTPEALRDIENMVKKLDIFENNRKAG